MWRAEEHLDDVLETVADARAWCIRFAEAHPTPDIRDTIRLAEAGAWTWFEVHWLFRQSMCNVLAREELPAKEMAARNLA